MIRVLNLNRETEVILENAYNIGYAKEVNAVWQASFCLPLNDPKLKVRTNIYGEDEFFITPIFKSKVKKLVKVEEKPRELLLKYVEIWDDDEYIGLFRILPKLTTKNESTQEVKFQCEHVLATLLDSSLFRYHQLTNYTTTQVLQYLLNQQKHKHWKLGQVDFTRYFHYSWENENLLSALFSVPRAFDEPYMWTFDTQTYPWTLNLVKPPTVAVSRIREGYNLIGFEVEENPMSQFNRIYPLGAGEGVNQLTIESVNNGIPYLEDRQPGEEIREVIWVDRRFTHAEHLKASAKALLDKWKKPIVTWKVSAADVSKITGLGIDKFQVGTVVRLQLDDFPTMDLRIMKESKSDIKGDPGNIQLEIGNVQEDLSTTQADLERRQQINELYSQGATNILNFTYQDNCDQNIPAVIPFYIDDDVVNVNTVELTFRTKKFRAYSRATEGGGAIVKSTSSGGGTTRTTSSGGGTTATSSSGGGVSRSTASGGGSTRSSGRSDGWDKTLVPYISGPAIPDGNTHVHITTVDADDLDHWHTVQIPSHTHDFSVPNHTHTVTIPNHTHEVTIPNHTHEIELPNHTHNVKHEIVELDTLPSSVVIKVDGNTVPHTSTSGDRINLIPYMAKDSDGKITRGRHEVTIQPNGLARIEADLILRVFIQSQLGGVF